MFVFDRVAMLALISSEFHLLNSDNLKCQLLAWVALIELRINCARYHLARYEIVSVSDDLQTAMLPELGRFSSHKYRLYNLNIFDFNYKRIR